MLATNKYEYTRMGKRDSCVVVCLHSWLQSLFHRDQISKGMRKRPRFESSATQTKVCSAVAFVALAVVLLIAPLRADDDKPRPKLPDAVQSIVDLARATAPEIFADTIVRLVESGKIPQRELQVELLEDALQAAGSATEPVRLIAIPGTPPDTREIYRSKAGELGLDAISLQSRILKNLLTVDRGKARELFEQVAHPVLDPRPCEDALVADVAPYYEIAGVIAQTAFTAEEKERGVQVQFLVGLLSAAKSPGELAAFAGAIENITFTPAQWQVLLVVLSEKLEKISADYRSFAVSFNAMQGAVSRLAEFGRANHVNVDGLIGSFRKYLVAQMTAPRCQPDIPVAIGEMEWFRPALSADEMKPSERRGSVKTHAYFESGDSKEMGERLKTITLWPDGNEVRVRAFVDPKVLSDFLLTFALWNPSGADVDVLHKRATVIKVLLATNLSDDDHARIVRLGVELLATSGAQRQNPAEWKWQTKSLSDAIGTGAADLFRASGNPGLLVYLSSSGTSK
jgi:hypothetical protein